MKQWLIRQLEGSGSLQAIVSAYHGLSVVTQRLVLLILVMIFSWLVIKFIAMPFYDDYQKSHNRLVKAQSDYALLVQHAANIASINSTEDSDIDRTSSELRIIVNNSIKEAQLAPEVISREGQSLLRVGISKAPFERVAIWLNQLTQQQVKINSMQIQVLSPGVVSLSITLD